MIKFQKLARSRNNNRSGKNSFDKKISVKFQGINNRD